MKFCQCAFSAENVVIDTSHTKKIFDSGGSKNINLLERKKSVFPFFYTQTHKIVGRLEHSTGSDKMKLGKESHLMKLVFEQSASLSLSCFFL